MKIINGNRNAVLFDLDGVIIDSESVYLDQIYSQIIRKYQYLEKKSLYPMVGMDDERTRIFMHGVTCEPLDNKEFDTYLQEVFGNMQVNDYKDILNPGVRETLTFLKAHDFKIALASSSKMHCIKKALKQCEIESFFDYVISGEQFKESKPNPEIYLTAIKAIGCTPEECIIVEDSSYGIEAGAKAGAYVIAKKDERFNIDQSKADYVIETIDEIIGILNKQ